MAVVAKLNYLRIAPRKVRLVADLIRGKSVEQAQSILNFAVKKSSTPLQKLLKSAISNAKHNFQLDESNLYISKITVDEGPKLKRWMPRARGSAAEIQKKTSHITIVLDAITKEKVKRKRVKVKKTEKVEEVEMGEREKEILKKIEKQKFKPETEVQKPKIEKGIRRIFRRKAS